MIFSMAHSMRSFIVSSFLDLLILITLIMFSVSTSPLICLKRIYNFLCPFLVLHQFLLVLSMLHGTFYAFYGTNLLTRCRSAISYFLLFLVSEKLHRKYSRNWKIQRPKFLFLPCRSS